jgi:hypothetical protein
MMEYYQRRCKSAQYLDADIPVICFRHIVLSVRLMPSVMHAR